MLWKILSALSAACLVGAAYFAWVNQKDLANERTRLEQANAAMKLAQERKTEADESLKGKQELLATTQKERDEAKEEVSKLTAMAAEKEAALAVIKGNLEQVTNQVTSVEKQIADAGDIENLVAQIENLKKDQLEAEGAVANQNQRVAASKEQYEAVVAQINRLRDAEAQGRRGIVAPDFTARVAQYFPEWDFAILSKGNSQGVFANADLEVKRGREVIAKLKVRNVEQNGSIADLVPGSLAQGQVIRAGDTVVAAAKQSAEESKPKPRAPGSPETSDSEPAEGGTEMPAGTDPFGAPPAGSDPFGGAPASTDPFGAPSPSTPAPANTDPFGAPATPTTPAGDDPFGAPSTPAAPAGGASMTEDPFGSN